ncbi:hypothetical protein CEV33_1628 [Brucella grignonensis]|uniref:Uncharacterized protein n=1 Tax=Brucella grignonensis TaxID=94627 RepID=A0A256FB66_9HYPH|nr:hypothetical protein CEV33_1628 [Brucella grignonensis]
MKQIQALRFSGFKPISRLRTARQGMPWRFRMLFGLGLSGSKTGFRSFADTDAT